MRTNSLRLRLVFAYILVETLMLTLLVANSVRLIENGLTDQTQIHIAELAPLLNSTLATPLAQKDYATAQEILKGSRHKNGIEYLVLSDRNGKIVAAAGWDRGKALPVVDRSLNGIILGDKVFDTSIPIVLDNHAYGELRYGINVDFLLSAKSHLLNQSIFIAICEVLLSILLLLALGYYLTRHLQMLSDASQAVANGRFDITLPVDSDDEIGRVARAFNTMTMAIRARVEDLSQSKEMQFLFLEQAQQEKARLASLLSAMNTGILFVNNEDHVVYCNPAFRHIWLIPGDTEMVGKKTGDVLAYCNNILAKSAHFSDRVLSSPKLHETTGSIELPLTDNRVLTQASYPVREDDEKYIGRLWIYEDVTKQRKTSEQLIYLAERDSLTGLTNRHRFQEELMRMATDVDRRKGKGSLLLFDLDEFKYINDTFGHRAGDTVLIRIASEISRLIRRNEFASRLGGDEFAVLIPDGDERSAQGLAERILRTISQVPIELEGQSLRLTASMGIVIYPVHANNVEELISHADAAMYQAKEAGKNTWRFYRHDLDSSMEMVRRLSWKERITYALENDLFKLYFQGVYRTQDQKLLHLEVLLRMEDPEQPGRVLTPSAFIVFAEKNGKILDIDRWVIKKSIALLAQSPLVPSLAVNISGRSFDEPTLPQYIKQQLEFFKVDPRRLYVELTETEAVSDLTDAQRFIDALHETGCTVCLDDFGAGFSSFAYLKHLKADILKIDGQFIRDLPQDHGNQLFVRAMVDLARGFGKKTIAEFVENAEILEMLKEIGIDMVQGYHLDKPTDKHPALNMLDPQTGTKLTQLNLVTSI